MSQNELYKSELISVKNEWGLTNEGSEVISVKGKNGLFIVVHCYDDRFVVTSSDKELNIGIHNGSPAVILKRSSE